MASESSGGTQDHRHTGGGDGGTLSDTSSIATFYSGNNKFFRDNKILYSVIFS